MDEADRARNGQHHVHDARQHAYPAEPWQEGRPQLLRQDVARRRQDGHRHGDADNAQRLAAHERPDDACGAGGQQHLGQAELAVG
eukprot:scaffold6866_cov118-Isochrysis_galbana.AAC.12